MKKKLLKSMRLLLVAAGLCVGTSAWADISTSTTTIDDVKYEVITIDFSSWTLGGTLTVEEDVYATTNSNNVYKLTSPAALSTYIATTNSLSGKNYLWFRDSKRLYAYGAGKYIAFLNLKAGDKIVVTEDYAPMTTGDDFTLANTNFYTTSNNSETFSFESSLDETAKTVTAILGEEDGELGFRIAKNRGVTKIVITRKAASVATPSASVTDLDGIARTVTLSCETENVTYQYKAPGASDYTDVEGNTFSATLTGNYSIRAALSGSYSNDLLYNPGAGVAVQLKGVNYERIAYDATNKKSTFRLTSSQSGVLFTPTVTIKYQIDGGEEQTYEDPVEVADGATFTYYAYNAKYANSESTELNPVAPIDFTKGYDVYKAINFRAEAAKGGFSVDSETNLFGSVYLAKAGDEVIDSDFGAETNHQSGLSSNSGLYTGSSGSRTFGVKGLTKGQYIVLTGYSRKTGEVTEVQSPNNAEIVQIECIGDKYSESVGAMKIVLRVTNTGDVSFNLHRQNGYQTLNVYTPYPESITTTVDDYATFSSNYPLDFASATGVKAYYASATDGSAVTMTKVTGAVKAGTGLLLQKTEGDISIPTAVDGTDLSTSNLLKPGTGVAVRTEGNTHRYVLAGSGDNTSFYELSASDDAVTIPEGKAYLEVVNAGARLSISFSDGEATGIANVKLPNATTEGVYNLNGQRVAYPTKGLYIVNGKKVIRK